MTLTLSRAHDAERIHTIAAMLETYDEARSEAGSTGAGDSRSESRYLTFDPQTWTPAYRELERCLGRLRRLAEHGRPIIGPDVSAAKAWWHLRERYLNARTVRREIHLERSRAGVRRPVRLPANMCVVGRPTILHGTTATMLVRVWDRGVEPRVVSVALAWLANEYRGTPAVYRETAA